MTNLEAAQLGLIEVPEQWSGMLQPKMPLKSAHTPTPNSTPMASHVTPKPRNLAAFPKSDVEELHDKVVGWASDRNTKGVEALEGSGKNKSGVENLWEAAKVAGPNILKGATGLVASAPDMIANPNMLVEGVADIGQRMAGVDPQGFSALHQKYGKRLEGYVMNKGQGEWFTPEEEAEVLSVIGPEARSRTRAKTALEMPLEVGLMAYGGAKGLAGTSGMTPKRKTYGGTPTDPQQFYSKAAPEKEALAAGTGKKLSFIGKTPSEVPLDPISRGPVPMASDEGISAIFEQRMDDLLDKDPQKWKQLTNDSLNMALKNIQEKVAEARERGNEAIRKGDIVGLKQAAKERQDLQTEGQQLREKMSKLGLDVLHSKLGIDEKALVAGLGENKGKHVSRAIDSLNRKPIMEGTNDLTVPVSVKTLGENVMGVYNTDYVKSGKSPTIDINERLAEAEGPKDAIHVVSHEAYHHIWDRDLGTFATTDELPILKQLSASEPEAARAYKFMQYVKELGDLYPDITKNSAHAVKTGNLQEYFSEVMAKFNTEMSDTPPDVPAPIKKFVDVVNHSKDLSTINIDTLPEIDGTKFISGARREAERRFKEGKTNASKK